MGGHPPVTKAIRGWRENALAVCSHVKECMLCGNAFALRPSLT
jgi:hypothetical protein